MLTPKTWSLRVEKWDRKKNKWSDMLIINILFGEQEMNHIWEYSVIKLKPCVNYFFPESSNSSVCNSTPLTARPWCSSFEHKQFHRTSTQDKATLWSWWIKTEISTLYNVWTQNLNIVQDTKHLPLWADRSGCCFLIHHSVSLVLVCLPLR